MDPQHVITQNVAPNSVTLSTNAKGKVQVEVKVYGATPGEAANAAMLTLNNVLIQLGDRAAP